MSKRNFRNTKSNTLALFKGENLVKVDEEFVKPFTSVADMHGADAAGTRLALNSFVQTSSSSQQTLVSPDDSASFEAFRFKIDR